MGRNTLDQGKGNQFLSGTDLRQLLLVHAHFLLLAPDEKPIHMGHHVLHPRVLFPDLEVYSESNQSQQSAELGQLNGSPSSLVLLLLYTVH